MKVLITGGAGFIGSHLAEYYCQQPDVEVVILDTLRTGKRDNFRSLPTNKLTYLEGSVTDAQAVLEAAKGATYVFHLASLVSVPESMQNPALCVEINVLGTLNVLKAAHHWGVKKVVLSSSAAVYGDEPTLPKHELMRPCPKSPYGITKLDGEYYLEMYRQEYGVPTASLRYFNVYGPRQDAASQYAAAVAIFIEKSLQGKPLTVLGDGRQTRDFIYVKDVVRANVHAAEDPAVVGVFNVANGTSLSIGELASGILKLVNSASPVEYGPPRVGDIRHSRADISKITATGFEPKTSLEDGLMATIISFAPQVRI